jgi:hypothetical protein
VFKKKKKKEEIEKTKDTPVEKASPYEKPLLCL